MCYMKIAPERLHSINYELSTENNALDVRILESTYHSFKLLKLSSGIPPYALPESPLK